MVFVCILSNVLFSMAFVCILTDSLYYTAFVCILTNVLYSRAFVCTLTGADALWRSDWWRSPGRWWQRGQRGCRRRWEVWDRHLADLAPTRLHHPPDSFLPLEKRCYMLVNQHWVAWMEPVWYRMQVTKHTWQLVAREFPYFFIFHSLSPDCSESASGLTREFINNAID